MSEIKFKITENTKRTSLKINGVLAVVGQEYDIALESLATIENTYGLPAEPLDNFKYKIIKDGIESVNEGNVLINFETNKSTNPNIINSIQNININESFYFSDIVPQTNQFDKITISQITGKGTWNFNGLPIYSGMTLFYYDLKNKLSFIANDTGSKDNYNVLKWFFQNSAFTYSNENSIVVNTNSLGILAIDSNSFEAESFVTYEQYIANLDIQQGKANVSFELVIDTNAFPNIGIDLENEIKIIINEVETIYNTSGVFTLSGVLSESGSAEIKCIIKRKTPSDVTSFISINLSSIDGLAENVDLSNNEQTILIPITII